MKHTPEKLREQIRKSKVVIQIETLLIEAAEKELQNPNNYNHDTRESRHRN